jgi:hypothetical protein
VYTYFTLSEVQESPARYLANAARKAREAAADGNTRGLMIARADDAVRFGFLVREGELDLALYGKSSPGTSVFALECVYEVRRLYEDTFVAEFLQTVGEKIGIEPNEVIRYFAEQQHAWRFVGWAGGAEPSGEDNGLVWRDRLWWRLRDIMAAIDGLADVPERARSALKRYIGYHSAEGKIVLVR